MTYVSFFFSGYLIRMDGKVQGGLYEKVKRFGTQEPENVTEGYA